MSDHKHKPKTYRLDMEYSGHDGRDYVYGYRLTCDCGASRVEQLNSAHAADKATKAWNKAGLKEEGR